MPVRNGMLCDIVVHRRGLPYALTPPLLATRNAHKLPPIRTQANEMRRSVRGATPVCTAYARSAPADRLSTCTGRIPCMQYGFDERLVSTMRATMALANTS